MSLVRIAVNLPEETVKRIDHEMHNHGWLSRSEVVRTALADWFRDRGPVLRMSPAERLAAEREAALDGVEV